MNKIIFLILFTSVALLSQNTYMIPDAGGPGMAVYVEFIGPHDQKNYFGSDGFYINNSGNDNRIEVSGGSSEFLEVSPFVVSWEGRMVSAYIYIDEDANPNSEDYNTLDNIYKNDVEVIIGGNSVSTYKFNIVRPSTIDPNNNAPFIGRVGNNAGIGYVSPRNTIVVDSLTLANKLYDINREDPDANPSNGNQAYLPLVILSKGPVRGLGSNSAIIASAKRKNAGPGGGGGAGAFCDILGGAGTNGGTGFTGGGAGGENRSGSSRYSDGGNGSGSNFLNDWNYEGNQWNAGGISLNGVAGGRTIRDGTYESSGGGTGHPFGRSAPGYNNNGDIGRRDGQYGGGTGNFANGRGGDAGFASDGLGDPGFYGGANGGKAHGNNYGVPIAGGSGGGSGNPDGNFGTNCGGDGGGGGGAVRLFAPVIENVIIRADGEDGDNGSPDGGAGSGGYIEISAKTRTTDVEYSASPGERGGLGRYRYDVLAGSPDIITGEEQPVRYRGFATDSSLSVESSHTLTGIKRFGPELQYYVKAKGGDWALNNTVAGGIENFDIPLDLSGGATQWYGASFLSVNDQPVYTSDYEQEPDFILSQAAANYFKLVTPEIECEDDISLSRFDCSESSLTYQIEIQNIGQAELDVDLSGATWIPNDGVATILNAENSMVISSGSSSFLEVEFNLPQGSPNPSIYELQIPTNDIDENPKLITFTINSINDLVRIETSNGIDTTNIEVDVCLNEDVLYFEIFQIQNLSGTDINNLRVENNGDDIVTSLGNNEYPIPLTVQLPKAGKTAGTYSTKIYLISDDCTTPLDSLDVTINVLETIIELQNQANNSFDFGMVKVGETDDQDLIFENVGNTSVRITENLLNITPPFSLINSQPNLPATLAPGEELILTVQFSPTIAGEFDNQTTLDFDENATFICDEQLVFEILGEGTQTDIEFPISVDWGVHEYCYFPRQETLRITNDGNTEYNITNTPVINGTDNLLFRFDGTNPADLSIPANGFIDILITLDLDENNIDFTTGIKEASISFETDDPFLPNFEVDLFAEFIEPDLSIVPASQQIVLGDVLYGLPVQFEVDLTNNSNTIGMNYERTEPNLFNNLSAGNPIETNESTTISWDFIPEEGNINESMTFWMRSDYDGCEYPYEVRIFGDGVRQDLNIEPQVIDFESNVKCIENLTEDIEISLDGIGEIVISSISLQNNNSSGAISILSDPPNISITSNTYSVTVFYDNISADYGDYSAELIINYTRNGEDETTVIPISASKVRILEIAPILLDFGDVPINETSELSSTITRLFPVDFTFEQGSEIGDDFFQTFPILDELENKPYPNSIEFITRFESNELGQHSSTYFLPYAFDNYPDCYDTLTFEIRANSVSNMNLLIFSEDMTIDPTLDNVDIPIYARLDNQSEYSFDIEELQFSIDRSVFYPNNVAGGQIDQYNYDGDNLIISISKENVTLSETDSLLAVVSGVPLLGDKKESIIEVLELNVEPTDLLSSATFLQNTLTLTVCEEGGDRLLKALNPIELTLINSSENIKINTNIIEAGKHTISVTDINGVNYFYDSWNREIGGMNEYQFFVSKSNLPTGIYFVKLRTPNRQMVKPLQIIK